MGERELTVSRGPSARPVQVRNARSDGFNKQQRGRFMKMLAATCNVRFAVKAAGVSYTTAYDWRRRDPDFAAQWQAAIVAGYERLEAALLARALGTDALSAEAFDFGDPEAVFPEAQIDAELALKLLARHEASVRGRARPMLGRVATEEETNRTLIKQLALLRRRIERSGGALLNPPALPAPDGGEA